MAKLTLTDLSSLTNETSAIATINANNALTEAALELTLSRNGLSPNTMSNDLDMNSFRILNIPEPLDDNDLVRLVDVAAGIRGEKGDTGEPGGPLADGDYGDVVVSSTGTVWTLDTSITDEISDATTAIASLGDASTLDVGTTVGTVADGGDSRFYKYTVTVSDSNINVPLTATATPTILYHTSGVAHAYTLSPASSIAHPIGSQFTILNSPTANTVTLTRGVAVALFVNGSTTSGDVTIAPGGVCNVIQIVNDSWFVLGSGLT